MPSLGAAATGAYERGYAAGVEAGRPSQDDLARILFLLGGVSRSEAHDRAAVIIDLLNPCN